MFHGAPAETIGVFTGIILQRKLALAQRIPILKDGLRQTVMEATHLVMDGQVTNLDKQRAAVAAGVESSSSDVVKHAADSAA
jgi:hypothetical protein